MKWIGQNIYDQVSRFRDKVYFEGDVEFNTDAVTFQSASAHNPIVTIKNTSNAPNDMASLNFVKDRDGGTAAINDNLAEIYFSGEDAGGQVQEYGRILSEIDVATHGQESGRLKLGVANHDGGNGYGLILQGGDVNDEVDVTVGLGAASVTTITGTLTMGSTAALTSAGLVAVANQSNITGLGTISSGVWNGDVIASAYLDADTAHLAGAQTFTGTKTLNSFKGTAGATVTNILDEDAMGSNSATALATQQSIKAYADRPAKQIVLKNFNFVASSGTTETFFPFAGTAEKTSDTDAAIVMIAPTAGKLLKLYMRASRDHSGQTTTITLYNWDADEVFSSGNKSSLGVQSATGPNTNEVVTFDFTSSLDSGTNAFTALETLAISYDNASAIGGGNTKYFFTAVFEYDFSGY